MRNDRATNPSDVQRPLSAASAALFGALALLSACSEATEPTVTVPFTDDFDREEIGPNYFVSGGVWFIEDGRLVTTGGNNAPAFLKAALPADVVVEVEVQSHTREVDSKVELMTDGRRHQSGYVFILGGWDNSISAIARLDEHGADRVEKKPTRVSAPATWQWRIEKNGGAIDWYVDGQPYLSFEDPNPLSGAGHDRFAFSNWQNIVSYDHLKIWPYADAPPRSTRP